uniref:hypothetical protein n=1 Tax=Cephaloticoccus sp. TaxID=1985742 RepID=UPI00404B8A59
MASSPMGSLYFLALFSKLFCLAKAWAAWTPLRPFCFAPLAAAAVEAEDADEMIAVPEKKQPVSRAATPFAE